MKISRKMARGRQLSWQIWFSQYEFEVEWVPENSNFLADALTREMNKAYITIKLLDPKYQIFKKSD